MWMTQKAALAHANREAAATGLRQRVFKSRAVVGWWNVNPAWPPRLLGQQKRSRPQE